jgi:hypothetical protein
LHFKSEGQGLPRIFARRVTVCRLTHSTMVENACR